MILLLECDADEILARYLGVPLRQIRHLSGKGDISNFLRKGQGLTALVDEDPASAPSHYLRGLAEDDPLTNPSLKRFRDRQRNHQVIVLCPRLEEWVVEGARQCGVQPSDFGISGQRETLHRLITQRLPALRLLLEAMEKAKCARLQALRKLLFP